MSSSERLLGDFLLECIPVTDFSTMTVEDIASTAVFAHEVTFFIREFHRALSTSKKAAVGAEDVLPGLICLIYEVIAKEPSTEKQLQSLECFLKQVKKIDTALKSVDDTTRLILDSLYEPATVLYFSSALEALIEKINAVNQNKTEPVLTEDDSKNTLSQSEKLSFQETISDFLSSENSTIRRNSIQEKLQSPEKERQALLQDAKEKEAIAREIIAKNSNYFKKVKTLIKELLEDSNKTLLSLQSKKTKGKKSYREINKTLEEACEKYQAELVKISEHCDAHDQVDENSAPFIQEQFNAIQTATQNLKNQNANIETLDSTRSNWFLQKLSDWIRNFCESHKKKLPNWNWLYNENARRLNTLFETVDQSIEQHDFSDTSESIRISSNTYHHASALLVQPAPQPVQHSAKATTDQDPTQISVAAPPRAR